MPKSMKHSAVASEIKKEYLKEHLKQVEGLITEWIEQLRAPGSFSPHDGVLGWESEYRPRLEGDPDSNHILRSHVRSRALWRHHTDWERQLTLAWSLVAQLREMSTGQLPLGRGSDAVGIWNSYIGTALLVAFEATRRKRRVSMNYKVPEDGVGVACGDFKIDIVAVTEEQRKAVQEQHLSLAKSMAENKAMKQLVYCWQEIEGLEDHMTQLASKILKSRDILYSCRFCRHLWK